MPMAMRMPKHNLLRLRPKPKSHINSSNPFSFSFPMALASASLFLLTLISALSFFLSSSSSSSSQILQAVCKATRYPDLCESSLPTNPTSLQIIQSAIAISDENLKTASSMSSSILRASSSNPKRTAAANNCLELLSYSHRRMASAITAGNNKDARAWISAALLYQYDCWSALKYVNGTELVARTMSFLDQRLMRLTSNALSMIFSYDNFGPDVASWAPPKTERDGFYEDGGGGSDPELGGGGGVPTGLKADVTVCKDDGCYKTVQEAVNAAPNDGGGSESDRRFVIRIKEGVYEETVRVPFEKKNVVLLGDGMGRTVITGSLSVGLQGLTTYQTATLGVVGDGFMASGLTIMNTAGPDAHQAVAFRSDSDLSVIENCEFIGNQDTLYAHGLRQFYKNCRIQGNVDFIFGNSAAVFQGCEILVAPRQVKPEKGETNAITAHGRTDPAQLTGFVFHNCSLNGTEDYNKYYSSKPKVHKTFLGRPWKEYSRTVFINCNLEALIRPEGWLPWSGDFALKTLFYGEFGNTGPGSQISQRVSWSTQIPTPKITSYSVHNFIQGRRWIPPSS